jgi:hypothetical protein
MLMKAMCELLGDEVLARDGRYGVLEDMYFDCDCWQLCYFTVSCGATQSVVPVGCVETAATARGRISLGLTREQLDGAGGAWPMADAASWLGDIRVCSARSALGWRIEAEDGPAGVVADLLVDRSTWSIDYVVVNITRPLGAMQVVLPLEWADPVDPAASALRMRRTRAQMCSAPAMSPASLLRARS